MKFSKKTMQLELFSHGSKSMDVCSTICPGQHNRKISTLLNLSGQLLMFQIPISLQHLEHILREDWFKLILETVKLYESIKKLAQRCNTALFQLFRPIIVHVI
jgi:hypothetical protein